MAWPLIISLAGTAAQMSAEDTEKKRAAEAAEKQALFDTEALQKEKERQRELDRMSAMARALDSGPQPLGPEYEPIRAKKVDYDPTLYETLAGVGKLAQQLGGYYAKSPTTNTGGQTYYSSPLTMNTNDLPGGLT